MKKFAAIVLSLILTAGLTSCTGGAQDEKHISMNISDRDVDVEYMLSTDLTVFGTQDPHKLDTDADLSLHFTESEPFESDDRMSLVSGTGQLEIYGQKYHFTIEEEIMSKVKVTASNTVYESLMTGSIMVEDQPVEINIDFVASEDFSQAVATVWAEDGMLFFGEIFNDYLEYFNMVLEGAL